MRNRWRLLKRLWSDSVMLVRANNNPPDACETSSQMTESNGNWIWFLGRVLGPFPAWEIALLASKSRYFLVCDRHRRWLRYRDWDRHLSDIVDSPPAPPRLRVTVLLKIRHLVIRRILRLYH